MKNMIRSLLLPLLCVGCVTADKVVSDTTPRPPTTAVDIFKGNKTPERHFKEIAELSFLGPREAELRAQKRFVKQAQTLGGNGLLFAVVPAGQKGGGMGGGWGVSTAWVFTGKVIVYD